MEFINQAALPFPVEFLPFLIIWSLVWKGLALWRAARRGSRYWFIFILVLSTVGILEILYLFVFSRPEGSANK